MVKFYFALLVDFALPSSRLAASYNLERSAATKVACEAKN
jgi:hypothetical protein